MRIRMSTLAVLAIACGSPTSVCGCSPPIPMADVRGRVERDVSAPVLGAVVKAEVFVGGCGARGPRAIVQPDSAVTGAGGAFRLIIQVWQAADSVCLHLAVRAPGAVDSAVAFRRSAPVGRRLRGNWRPINVTLKIP